MQGFLSCLVSETVGKEDAVRTTNCITQEASKSCSGNVHYILVGILDKRSVIPKQKEKERESYLGPRLIEWHLRRCSTSAADGHGNLIEQVGYWGMEFRLGLVGQGFEI